MGKDDLTTIYESENEREKETAHYGADRPEEEPLSMKATYRLIGRTLLLTLGIGFIFLFAFLLFILFCVYVWF